MVALLVILAIIVAGLPLTAVLLVTVACRQEESAHSMAGCAPGRLARAARRLLAFQAVGITRPASQRSAGRPAGVAAALTTTGRGPAG
jgi:hypothetical protein